MRTRAIGSAIFAGALVLASAVGAGAACTDQAAVAATRAAAEIACPCGGFETHGAYVSCVAGVAKAASEAVPPTLPKNCKGAVVRCAAKSTCGKPDGFVTCCRITAAGKTKCSLKSDASLCKPPKNGSACVGTDSSCCDACPTGVCGGSPSGAFLEP